MRLTPFGEQERADVVRRYEALEWFDKSAFCQLVHAFKRADLDTHCVLDYIEGDDLAAVGRLMLDSVLAVHLGFEPVLGDPS